MEILVFWFNKCNTVVFPINCLVCFYPPLLWKHWENCDCVSFIRTSVKSYDQICYPQLGWQCSAVQFLALQCSEVLWFTVYCSAVLYSAVQYCTVLCSTLKLSKVQCRAVFLVQRGFAQCFSPQFAKLLNWHTDSPQRDRGNLHHAVHCTHTLHCTKHRTLYFPLLYCTLYQGCAICSVTAPWSCRDRIWLRRPTRDHHH